MMVYMYFREFTEIFPEPKDGLNKSSHHQGKSKGYIYISIKLNMKNNLWNKVGGIHHYSMTCYKTKFNL